MKKTPFITLIAMSLSLALALSTPVSAADEVNKMEQTDETQAQYQRKALMVMPNVTFASAMATVSSQYCFPKATKKGTTTVCIPTGSREYPVSASLQQNASDSATSWLSQSRFDLVQLHDDTLLIKTADETIKHPAKGLRSFNANLVSYSSYQSSLNRYLQNDLQTFLMPLQKAALGQRYAEMPTQEQATFMRTQAKSLGLPATAIPILLNNQFVMGVYQPKIRGSVTTTLVVPKKKPRYYSTSFNLTLKSKLTIYQYDANTSRYKPFETLVSDSGSIGASTTYKHRPRTVRTTQALFDRSFKVAFRSGMLQVQHQLKGIDAFQLKKPVIEVDGSDIIIGLSAQDDLRVDALFELRAERDGKMEYVGWAKARKVSPAIGSKSLPSQFEVIKGDAEQFDLAFENTWVGGYTTFSYAQQTFEFNKLGPANVSMADSTMSWFEFGKRVDQGYFNNREVDSESWLNMTVAIGTGSGPVESSNYLNKWDEPLGLKLKIESMSHNTLGAGLSFGYGYGVGLDYLNLKSADGVEEHDASWMGVFVHARTELTYFLGADAQLGFFAEYPMTFYQSATMNDEDVDSDLSPGLSMGLNYQTSLETFGFLSAFYKQ